MTTTSILKLSKLASTAVATYSKELQKKLLTSFAKDKDNANFTSLQAIHNIYLWKTK